MHRVDAEMLYRLQMPVDNGAVLRDEVIHHAVTLDDGDVCIGGAGHKFLLVGMIADDVTNQGSQCQDGGADDYLSEYRHSWSGGSRTRLKRPLSPAPLMAAVTGAA